MANNAKNRYYSVTIRFDKSKHLDLIEAIEGAINETDTDRSKVVRELMRRGIRARRVDDTNDLLVAAKR